MSSPLRRITGVLFLVLTPVVATAAGLAAFLAAATLTARLPLLSAAGVVVMGLTAVGVGATGWRLLCRRGRTAGFAVLVTLACAGLAGTSILVPGARPAAGPAPAWVRFWTLPTGSHLAYAHLPATGPKRPYPVVFLHGGPGTPGNGLPGVAGPVAAAGFDVYAYDQLGAGRSTRLDDVTGYTVARQVADLDAIRTAIHADRLVLVGQSWGGSLAAQYLAAYPDHVQRVAFTSPGPIWPSAWPDGGTGDPWERMTADQRRHRDKLVDRPRIYAQAALQGINPQAAHALVGDDEADELMHRIAVLGKDATSCTAGRSAPVHDNHQGFYVNQLTVADFATIADPRPALRRITVPAMIMRGGCDFVPWEVAREYRDTLPNAALVSVPDAGHGIAADQPDLYERLLVAFLTGRQLPVSPYTGGTAPVDAGR
ncbi:alpha/beta fold hydrolase [Micromonospora sp. NBC_00421]|uniref:alpha/beta fold hydrolase n=1 Tax=Micromonospora sp. NBC_00421 TaxID=2975976 RepID=UPI002E2017BC